MSTIKIKQVKSRIGAPADQKRTLDALGLRKLNRVVEHEETPSIVELTWEAEDPTVAELVLSGHETLIHGLTAGETTIYMTVICDDGTEQMSSVDVTVAPMVSTEDTTSSAEGTAEPEKTVPTETAEPVNSNAGVIIGVIAILLVGGAAAGIVLRKKRRK